MSYYECLRVSLNYCGAMCHWREIHRNYLSRKYYIYERKESSRKFQRIFGAKWRKWKHREEIFHEWHTKAEKKNKIRDMTSSARLPVNCDLIRVLIIVAFIDLVIVDANSDHCSSRKFASAFNTTYMQFTKEIVSEEYAIEGEFKNLHCCAKGYRSIEW